MATIDPWSMTKLAKVKDTRGVTHASSLGVYQTVRGVTWCGREWKLPEICLDYWELEESSAVRLADDAAVTCLGCIAEEGLR